MNDQNPGILLWEQYSSPSVSVGGLGPGPRGDPQIRRCSSPLYKTAQNKASSQPSTSKNSQPRIENTVFHPRLVESMETLGYEG